MKRIAGCAVVSFAVFALSTSKCCADASADQLRWDALPDLPNPDGVAGSFVGTHHGALIIAGGANFPKPVWDTEKVWHDTVYVLTNTDGKYEWHEPAPLARRLAYGASVSTKDGIVCIGGNDGANTFADVFLISWNPTTETIAFKEYPPLPQPQAYGSATAIGDAIYVAGGQTAGGLETATSQLWVLDVSAQSDDSTEFAWKELPACPGPPRAFNLTVAQHNGYDKCVYVISGRRINGNKTDFLVDTWEFNPKTSVWRSRADAPQCVMAGTAAAIGQSHLFVLGGADGLLFARSDALGDKHPGFPKTAFAYNTITNAWNSAGSIPANHVTTTAVAWDGGIVIASGEVRPRVRSPKIWRVTAIERSKIFGPLNYVVLVGYLAAMVGVGAFFARANKTTDDYFRGGKHIPWWAAGCSIFATMLSSLTYTGVPSKAFAQDWVYAFGNFMIPVVAFFAVFVALPFYRRIDVTSAYEYLEQRFNRAVRLFASCSFTLFHIFRMAVVMSLTGLALAVATPLTPSQSVILMGVLSILYCTMGGIEAVIWTDTIQTFVLLGGALLALWILIAGVDGGTSGFFAAAIAENKFAIANFHTDVNSAQLAFWVIIVGGIGQNISSYTADQAVVQRYMTTTTQSLAARSIWTNAVMTIPATIIFFGIGTALFAFYQSHPEKLDATITTDQILPLFIATEMPAGVAGLLVAGIFAAAQSTVSTSMNSTATTLVTDILRPFQTCKSEVGYLYAARALTFAIGAVGTVFGLMFVNPDIHSRFDSFLKVIGMFMGVLGGLFVLGVATKRANATGAIIGAIAGSGIMLIVWAFSSIQAYLYTAIGISTCFAVGYVVSRLVPEKDQDLQGLTLYTQ